MGKYYFPADIDNSPEYGQMMIFTAYTPQSARFGVGNRRMLDQMCLYVPGGGQNNLSWQQRHDYDDVKMSRLGTGAASGMLSSILGIGGDVIGAAGSLAGGIFKTQINPYVEVLYRGTDLRAFNFSFMFAPQSPADANQLYGQYGLLSRFRYHAAPEFAGKGELLFKSPSEWEIDFYYRAKNGSMKNNWEFNKAIPRIAKGVLTRVDVDYNPDTEYSTFETGEPTSSRLTMQFVEMEIIDKSRINDGF